MFILKQEQFLTRSSQYGMGFCSYSNCSIILYSLTKIKNPFINVGKKKTKTKKKTKKTDVVETVSWRITNSFENISLFFELIWFLQTSLEFQIITLQFIKNIKNFHLAYYCDLRPELPIQDLCFVLRISLLAISFSDVAI